MSRPVDSSIRSRQTGQVGISIREGVGGAIGFEERDVEGDNAETCRGAFEEAEPVDLLTVGVKGSFVMSGNDTS